MLTAVAADPPPDPPVSPYIIGPADDPPLYFVVPYPDAAEPPAPGVNAAAVLPPVPALARTPVEFDVGAVLLDASVDVLKLSHVSLPLPPLVFDAVAPVPPVPIE